MERVWVNTSGLDVAGAYIVDAQLTKGNSGQLLTQFDSNAIGQQQCSGQTA